jgi:hypothetical protein
LLLKYFFESQRVLLTLHYKVLLNNTKSFIN